MREQLAPKQVKALQGIPCHTVSCGELFSVAVSRQEGRVYSWGDATLGQLGQEDTGPAVLQPCSIPHLAQHRVLDAACGSSHTAVLTDGGSLYTWGKGMNGQLGHGRRKDQCLPQHMQLEGVHLCYVACGSLHTMAVAEDGVVYSWGDGSEGRLGHGDEKHAMRPRAVAGLSSLAVASIACGGFHTAVVAHGGRFDAEDMPRAGLEVPLQWTKKQDVETQGDRIDTPDSRGGGREAPPRLPRSACPPPEGKRGRAPPGHRPGDRNNKVACIPLSPQPTPHPEPPWALRHTDAPQRRSLPSPLHSPSPCLCCQPRSPPEPPHTEEGPGLHEVLHSLCNPLRNRSLPMVLIPLHHSHRASLPSSRPSSSFVRHRQP